MTIRRAEAPNVTEAPAAPIVVQGNRAHRVVFPNLDALRFFAFLIVFLLHGFAYVAPTWQTNNVFATTARIALFQSGQVGVSFFFVLSGFLITYLILTEIDRIGVLDVKAFYIRRVLRIWPLYYLLLFYAFVIHPLVERHFGLPSLMNPRQWLYFLFLGNFDIVKDAAYQTAITNITWSVAVEEQFYLTWPLIFRLVRRRYYPIVFAAIIIGATVFRWLHRADGGYLVFHTVSVISDMAIGGVCAYLARYSERFRTFFRTQSAVTVATCYTVAALVVVFNRFLFVTSWAAGGRLVLAAAFAYVILDQNYGEAAFKLSRLPVVSTLGKYTYGLYLLHPTVIWYVVLWCTRLHIDIRSSAMGLVVPGFAFAGSVIVAAASYHLYEKRFLVLKERYAHVKNVTTVSTTEPLGLA